MLVLNLEQNGMKIWKPLKRGNAPLGSGAPARKLTLWLYISTELHFCQHFCVILLEECLKCGVFGSFSSENSKFYQFIGGLPHFLSCSLQRLKHLLPKNPLCAESGDGCADSITRCLEVSMSSFLLRASRPQRIKTKWSEFAFRYSIMCFVKVSQPCPRWLPAWCASTVRVLFSRRTPCFVQRVRSPEFGIGAPTSSWISLKILRSDGGIVTPGWTEKARPLAWPGPWYGSWPIMMTRTSFRLQAKAEKTCSRGGYMVLLWYSWCKKWDNWRKYVCSNSPPSMARHDSWTSSLLMPRVPIFDGVFGWLPRAYRWLQVYRHCNLWLPWGRRG